MDSPANGMSRERRDQELFDRIARRYARKDSCASSALARRNKLFSALKPILEKSGTLGTMVDVGCGIGGPAKYLAGRYERYIGIDHSPELIELARACHGDNPRAEFIAANIKSEGLPSRVADVVLSDGALHHMSELDKVLESLGRIAKPGAFIVVIEPQNANPLIAVMRGARKLLDPAYSRDQASFSWEDLRCLFLSAGISDIAVDYQGFFSTPFAEVVLFPQAVFIPLSRLAGALDRWLQGKLPVALKKMSFNIVVSGHFPGGD